MPFYESYSIEGMANFDISNALGQIILFWDCCKMSKSIILDNLSKMAMFEQLND